MRTTKQFIAMLLCALLSAPATLAQSPQRNGQTDNAVSQDVLIIIEQQQVRFTARSAVEWMQLQVFNPSGEPVFDSGPVAAGELKWSFQNGNGEAIKSGLYGYTLSIKEIGKETGTEAARVRRGHFIVDRAQDRDGTDKLWVTSQNASGVGAELTVARDENATVVGVPIRGERTAGQRPELSTRDGKGRETEVQDQSQTAHKESVAAVAAGTVGKIAKFTSATDLGDSVISEVNANVGIGTATPTEKLTVQTTSGGYGITHTDGSVALSTWIGNSDGYSGGWLGTKSNHSLNFFTANGTSRMTINPAGNVGIGTGSLLTSKLTIEGQDAMTVRGYQPFITFLDSSNGNARGAIQQVNGGLNLFTESYSSGANPFAYLRLDNSGNVGIGSATPQAKLEVVSGSGDMLRLIGYAPFISLFDSNSGYSPAYIQNAGGGLVFKPTGFGACCAAMVMQANTGNIGIGTANPLHKLHVSGPATVLRLQSTNNNVWTVTEYATDARIWHAGVGGSAVSNDLKSKYYIYDANAGRVRLAIDTNGLVSVNALQITGGADFSENFDINAVETSSELAPGKVKPGMVVSIDPTNSGKLRLSTRSYDRRVAGIISGAGGVKPGMVMSQEGTLADGKHPVALSGRVYCWVDASHGAVKVGDLLTTSTTPGYAMKAMNRAKAQGAILGKAMTSLKEGKGLVLVLVTLQ